MRARVHTEVLIVVVALLTFVGVAHEPASAEVEALAPWSADPAFPVTADAASTMAAAPGPVASVSYGRDCCALWLGAYRGGLSSLFAVRCAHYPSCSVYSSQAIEAHGAFAGMVLTVDRMLREWDNLSTGRLELINGSWLYRDPLEPSVFWWNTR